MTQWVPVDWDFDGSTESIRRLVGKKVRSRGTLHSALVYDPTQPTRQQTYELRAGTIGFVANPHPSMRDLLIAIPTDGKLPPSSLAALSRSQAFTVLVVNAPTFRLQFEFET